MIFFFSFRIEYTEQGLLPIASPATTTLGVVGPFANVTAFLMGDKVKKKKKDESFFFF